MRSRFTIDFRKQSGGRDPISPGRRWGLGARSRQTRPMHTDSLVGTPEERIAQLEFENDILREVVEALKAGSLESMTGEEKTLAINALRQKTGRPLKELAVFSRISKSSYEYKRCSLEKPDKYTDVRAADNRGVCRAERGEWIPLRPLGDSNPGEPHRHIGKGDRAHHGRGGLFVEYDKKPRRRYSSYAGEISEAPPIRSRGISIRMPKTACGSRT